MNLAGLMQQAAAAVQSGDLARAEPLLLQIVGANPRDAEAWHVLAVIAVRAGRPLDAVEQAGRAHALDRRNPLFLNTLGVAHSEAGNIEEAVRCFNRAIKERPAHAESHYNLGKALAKLEDWPGAERSYKRARQLDPSRADFANNLAALYCHLGRFGEALPLLNEAYARTPGDETVATNRSIALHAVSGPAAAIEELASFALRYPQAAKARVALGRFLLAHGRVAEGWREYAWRRPPPGPLPGISPGQRSLLLPEQGIGDHLFFLRFVPGLRECGVHVAFACPPKIAPLLAETGAVDELCPENCRQADYDVAVSIGDLPLLLHDWRTPPPVRLNAGPVAEWRERLADLGPAPYLGVTWRGGTRRTDTREFAARGEVPLYKEIGVETLATALRGWRGTVLVLQRLPAHGEVAAFSKALGRPAHDLSALNDSLLDMSAVLTLIEEYVGVSNANMHIRAGLGRCARVLVPFPPEFRWMDAGEESPWFPGFRVLRQPPSHDWSGPLAALHSYVSS
jgi:Flp pilus assembly protein TadD